MPTQHTQTTAADGHRLKPSEYIGYALGDTASNFFFQTFNIFLTYYYVDVWGISATALLWMIPLVRAFGAFDDVIGGEPNRGLAIVENSHAVRPHFMAEIIARFSH